MKLLIIGMLGAGKSTLAYRLAQKHKLPVLRIDEISGDKCFITISSKKAISKLYHILDGE